MKRWARLLIEAKQAKPQLFHYLEALETRFESQSRELRMLRWTLSGERFADLDEELDLQIRHSWIDEGP